MSKRIGPLVAAVGLVVAGCGGEAEQAMPAQPVGGVTASADASPASFSATWTRERVEGLFLNPAEAGLRGGEVHIEPQGTTANIPVCVPLNPFDTPRVMLDSRFSTLTKEIGLPGKGRIVQRGWVLPNATQAGKVMKSVEQELSACRYNGAASTSMEPGQRLSGKSTVYGYPRDAYGWHGYRVEQTANVNRKRASVGTELLLHRGPVILRLDYMNYAPRATEQKLRAYNMSVLRKVITRPA